MLRILYQSSLSLSVMMVTCLLAVPATVHAARPVADMHLHYKWSQQEVTSPEQAVAALSRENIVLGVVIGTPAELALELEALAPEHIVPIFSPYREGGDWHRWQHDEGVITRARKALASGDYAGIGELHIIGGFAPSFAKATILRQLLLLADAFDVPVMLHTEFSRPDFMLEACAAFPEVTLVWAHSGAILPPADVRRVLAACDNVHAGLGARDPWRFVDHPITGADGMLLPHWRALLLDYPARFMTGSDPVWPVEQLDSWDEPDTGWREIGRFWGYHRDWLAQLPPDVARAIGCENALRLFAPGRDPVEACSAP